MKVNDHISSWFWNSLVTDTWEMPCSYWKVFPKVSLGCSVAVSADENTVYTSVATGDEELLPQCNLNLLGFSLDGVKCAERDSCMFEFIWLNKICFICAFSGSIGNKLWSIQKVQVTPVLHVWIQRGSFLNCKRPLCYSELWAGTDCLGTKNGSLQMVQVAWSSAVLKGSFKFSHKPLRTFFVAWLISTEIFCSGISYCLAYLAAEHTEASFIPTLTLAVVASWKMMTDLHPVLLCLGAHVHCLAVTVYLHSAFKPKML